MLPYRSSLSLYLLFLLLSLYYRLTLQAYCVLSCDCSYTTLRFINGEDCCTGTSMALRANIDFDNRTDCTPCPSRCATPQPPCFIEEISGNYRARMTRPTAGKPLFRIPAHSFTCPFYPNQLLYYLRGNTVDDAFISVQGGTGAVFMNANLSVGNYSGTVIVSLTDLLLRDSLIIPISYEVYDAVSPNATMYTGTAFDSAIGGQYLFTVGINEAGFSLEYSTILSSVSVNSTAGHVFTSTQNPPLFGTYDGLLRIIYSHNTDSSLAGTIGDVPFSFTVAYPVTINSTFFSTRIPYPPSTPADVLAFTIVFNFAPGFSMNDFIYDFTESETVLNVDHSNGEFSFPFTSATEIRRYPGSGNANFLASYFSKEMYSNGNSLNNVYKRTITGVYNFMIVDPCGFSPVIDDTCLNSGTCSLEELDYLCACNEFYTGRVCEFDINECSNASFCNNFQCTNEVGSFKCSCSSGYTGTRCFQNVDECLMTPPICLNNGVCMDNFGSYTCDCNNTGYTGANCQVNVNECAATFDLCGSGICLDINGSYVCVCTGTGFKGVNCQMDIDECMIGPGPCEHNGVCTNTKGSFICECTNTGFTGRTCSENKDECNTTVALCSTGRCVDTLGSYFCDCNGTGFVSSDCSSDVNECSLNSTLCNDGLCTNTIGSYRCNCTVGFEGTNCEQDINECDVDNICNNGSCFNTHGSFHCQCIAGFIGELCGRDIMECDTIPGLCSFGNCSNTLGSYACDCGNSGYRGQNCTEDINECGENATICNNGTCVNTNGSYHCICSPGFTGADCSENINECLLIGVCNNGSCIDVEGSFYCVCLLGISGVLCGEDVNECAANASLCNNGVCANSFGSFACDCDVGFMGETCEVDTDECTIIPSLCLPGNCSNTQGSYACDCVGTGFMGQNCTEDINECAANASLCNNGVCVNSFGSFACDCDVGFMGDICEVDTDECTIIPGLCLPGNCSNTQGSYACDCVGTGFMGQNCTEDINECLNTSLCRSGACVNNMGSYFCNCTSTGYTGANCEEDINECDSAIGLCGSGTCINNQGSFSCDCANTGLIGERCEVDIDECSRDDPCENSGRCNNTFGAYTCDCTSTGYTGVNCTVDVNECLTPAICNLGTCVNNRGNYSCICPEGVTGMNCDISINGTLVCPANMACTSDSDCMDCLCHRNFSYISPVHVLLSRSLQFDGNLILPFEREIQPELANDVTIFARLRQDFPDRGYVMFIGSSTDYRNIGLFLDSNTSSTYLFYTRPGATSYSSVRVALEVIGPSMHTIAVVLNFNSSQVLFYKDGVLVTSQTLTGPPDYRLGEKRNARVMYVGGRIENAFKFRGDMEQVFLYPFALSASQIQSLDQNGPIIYQGTGRCGQDVLDESCVPRPFYAPSVPTQHHTFRSKTRCDSLRYANRGLNGEYKCGATVAAVECLENSDCPSGYACGEYLSRDGHSLLPAVFDPYFHGFKYALVETPTTFSGVEPITVSITKRPILTLDLSIFTRFSQRPNNEGYIVAKGVSAHARDFGLYLRGTSDSVWFVYKSKTGFHDYAIFSNITVDDGNVHTMGVVLLQVDNSRFVYLYVDGMPRGCVKINNRVVFTPEVNRLTVGGRPGNDKFNFIGVIYKLHIFDVALTHSVILDLHQAFSTGSIVRYCAPLQARGDECYIERRPPFFKCDSDLGCVPSIYFNRTLPVLPQQNICFGAPYTIGQCIACSCTPSTSDQLVCGTNGVTYANTCFLSCAGATLFTQGACVSYADRFEMSAPGE